MFSYIFHKKFKTDAEYLHQEMPHFYDQKGQPCRLPPAGCLPGVRITSRNRPQRPAKPKSEP